VLTKKGMSSSRWILPDFLRNIKISYHSEKSWKDGYFQSAGRGQEFVFSTNEKNEILNWISDLIGVNHRHKNENMNSEFLKSDVE
jgi:hypothetical protein